MEELLTKHSSSLQTLQKKLQKATGSWEEAEWGEEVGFGFWVWFGVLVLVLVGLGFKKNSSLYFKHFSSQERRSETSRQAHWDEEPFFPGSFQNLFIKNKPKKNRRIIR